MNPSKPIAIIAATLLCSAVADSSSANSASAGDDTPVELEPRLQVTASRTAENTAETLATVTVITAEDIRRSQAEDLLELLRLQPGVDVVRSGGPGAQTSVFLRGTNSNHVLVLIDGVRVASANSGAYAWEQLPVNLVASVEIVRGPRASQYGSDAIGGVIQVFTRSDPSTRARLTGGSHGTSEFEAGFGFEGERHRLSINAGYRDVDGFSAQNPDGFAYDADDDGFEAKTLGINGSVSGDRGSWRYSILASDTETEFDQGVSNTDMHIASLSWEGALAGDWSSRVQAGYATEDLESDFGFFVSGFKSDRVDLSWRNQRDLGDGWLALGIDHYSESGVSGDGIDENRHNTGVFAQLDALLGPFDTQIAARWDDNSEFGSEFTGQVAAGYSPGEHGRLVASYGHAFRAPNLNEQFSPGFGGYFAGNPDLAPESSASLELSWRQAIGDSASLMLSAWHTEIEDLIAFEGGQFHAINVDEARINGMELEFGRSSGDWATRASLTLQDAKNRGTGEDLLRRPDRKGSLTVDRLFDNGGWLGFEWLLSGDRMDFGGVPLAGYGIVNLRSGWPVSPSMELQLRMENLGDRGYLPAWGFDSAGRSFYVSLEWQP